MFPVGSEVSIDDGRISKRLVRTGDEVVMNYNRGWMRQPKTRADKAVLRDILAGFPGVRERGTLHLDLSAVWKR